MSCHTPLPWYADPAGGYFCGQVPGGRPGGEVIGRCWPSASSLIGKTPDVANAEFIARACNGYEEAVDAVEAAYDALQHGWTESAMEALRPVLVKAGRLGGEQCDERD